ncbi:MAG TPA: TonB-dependent receptor [Gemmatimonadaceae bacterium]|nr:TonB-dependent receptor [Gemmatimonadaceae bacterium]
MRRAGAAWLLLLLCAVPAALAAQGVARDTAAAARDSARAAADTGGARRDSVRAPADTAAGRAVPLPSDTLADTSKVPKDTIKAALAHASLPPLLDPAAEYRWNRDQLFSIGNFTLFDLLSRIPGVTTFRSGWLASPMTAAYLGDPSRVRVFIDGVEIDALDPRSPGALDLGEVQLWSLESLEVERGADELRVYARTWSVRRTTTSTRVDVADGSQSTTLYRGFYGKRYGNGMAFQVAGQQFGTSSNSDVGGGDELSLIGRLGWAKRKWSLDAFATRASRSRDEQVSQLGTGTIPPQERTRLDGYVRAGYGDPDSGSWVQAIASTHRFDEHTPFSATDNADTVRTVAQYVAAAGITRGPVRLSATDRFRMVEGSHRNALSARASFDHAVLGVSFRAEHRGADTTSEEEAAVRLSPLSFLSLNGAVTRRHGGGLDGGSRWGARGSLDLRLGRTWLSGGVLRRDVTVVPGLIAYDTAFHSATSAAATGVFGSIRGKIYKDLGVDLWGVRWNAAGWYRPQLQSREELYIDTKWMSRFPSGNFGFLGSVAHEYRQNVLFPVAGASEAFSDAVPVAVYSHTIVTRVEIRIQDAVIFWNSSYGIRPQVFEYVPGFLQPRQRFVYGVRWQFWN